MLLFIYSSKVKTMVEGKTYKLKNPAKVSYGIFQYLLPGRVGWGVFYFPELGDQEDENSWGDWPLSQFIII